MKQREDHEPYVSKIAAERLSTAFSIDGYTEGMQDWEIELADGSRTEEFLDSYERCDWLDDDEKFALMALIVASFDEWSPTAPTGHPLPERLRLALISDFQRHMSTISYWCLWDEISSEPDDVFAITPFMRRIWCSQRPMP